MSYAEGTTVTVQKSIAEIDTIVSRNGADQFMIGRDVSKTVIRFRVNGYFVNFDVPMAKADDMPRSKHHPRRDADKWADQESRRRFRSLALVVKAKFEAVAAGFRTFEQEFLSDIVLPDGGTVYQWFRPQLTEAYDSGKMPQNLMALPEPKGQTDGR